MSGHVLFCRLDSDGDVLLAGPAVRAVAARARFITFVCGPRGRAAAELLPGVDQVVAFHAPWIDPEPEPVAPEAMHAVVDEVARLRADEAIVLTSFHQSALPTALLLRLACVRRISAISDDYPGSLLDVRHHVADDLHEVERGLSLAEAAGYGLPAGDDATLAVKRPPPNPLGREGGPYVVVHPGASVPARAWSAGKSAQLVRALVERGRRVVVTGGPDERRLTADVASAAPGAVDLGGRTTLSELSAVLAGAETVVVGNTGPAHLAAAVGTPVVSLFAPVVPAERWRPWGVPHVVLGDQRAACRGSRARDCPVPGHPCLDHLPIDAVADAVDLLTRSGRPEAVAA